MNIYYVSGNVAGETPDGTRDIRLRNMAQVARDSEAAIRQAWEYAAINYGLENARWVAGPSVSEEE